MTMKKSLPLKLSIFISLIWVGMILGISFLEAPVKFQAPSVTLQIGLDIGRLVFEVFNKVEITFALVLLVSVILYRPGAKRVLPFIIAAVVLAFESIWLLPVLDERAAAIIAGQTPPPSSHHTIYVVLELIKVFSLAVFALLNLQSIPKKTA